MNPERDLVRNQASEDLIDIASPYEALLNLVIDR
jgi:hypothetical protein